MCVRARVLTNLVSHSYVNKRRGIFFTRCSVRGSSETGSPCVRLLVCGNFWYEKRVVYRKGLESLGRRRTLTGFIR